MMPKKCQLGLKLLRVLQVQQSSLSSFCSFIFMRCNNFIAHLEDNYAVRNQEAEVPACFAPDPDDSGGRGLQVASSPTNATVVY